MIELLVLSVTILGYALVSERLAMSPVTAPMVFTSVGLLAGSAGFAWFDVGLDSEVVSVLVEATLVLVLFTDAVRIDLRVLRRESGLPVRLLGIGLPIMVVGGAVAAWLLFPALSLAEAGLIGAILAPTDAALGQAVVSDRRLPVRIRQGLNVESGLNDGIALPVVTVLLALAVAEEDPGGVQDWLTFAAQQVGVGVVAGVLAGAGAGWLLERASTSGRVEGLYRQLGTIAIVVGAFAAAELGGGNGFIAAFVAGLAFGAVAREHCRGIQDFTEDEGELLSVITFTVFGALIVAPFLDELTWAVAAYVVASLVVLRVVAVLVAMAGSGTLWETRIFVGWFGPRGLASILFGLLVFDEVEGTGARQVVLVVMWTVLVSVFVHGATASPWTARLSRRIAEREEPMPETEMVTELPTRRRLGFRRH